jgi:hypothetical protein
MACGGFAGAYEIATPDTFIPQTILSATCANLKRLAVAEPYDLPPWYYP